MQHKLQTRPLSTPTDLAPKATKEVSAAMNAILADVFALYQNKELPLACERSSFS